MAHRTITAASGANRNHRGRDPYDGVEEALAALAALEPGSAQWVDAREEILRRCLPLADHIARRFTGRGESYDDLHQIAGLGLVLAVDRFDAARGDSFLAFAVPTIMGEVRRHFRDHTWAVRVPRRTKEIQLRIGPAVETLSQRLGRMPTALEIAIDLGVDLSEVTQGLLAGNAYRADPIDPRGDGEEMTGPADSLGAEDPEFELTDQTLVALPLLDELPALDRHVLYLRFFRELTQAQIAAELGVSQMHISRMLTRILGGLRSRALGEEPIPGR